LKMIEIPPLGHLDVELKEGLGVLREISSYLCLQI
jgi:hypothetical protein